MVILWMNVKIDVNEIECYDYLWLYLESLIIKIIKSIGIITIVHT